MYSSFNNIESMQALLRHAWDAYRRCIFALPIVFLPYK
ncbi:Uncharacterised protein [Vibrio cholerae]|nr:Uncharacterised protein [Vibrio cholerae]CSI84716.1 Uncharacterised protein [Vibrio cholerae]